MNAQRILVLSPYTDDGEFGCGGAICKWLEESSDVYLTFPPKNYLLKKELISLIFFLKFITGLLFLFMGYPMLSARIIFIFLIGQNYHTFHFLKKFSVPIAGM